MEPAALDDAELKDLLRAVVQVRSRLEAFEAAAIAEFDRRGCFVLDGAANAKAWLAHHTGTSRVIAGSRVLQAKRLARMSEVAAALAAGEITEGHARAAGRCLTPRTTAAFARDEGLLVDQARSLEADQFDLLVTRWLQLNDGDGPEPGDGPASQAWASRTFGGRVRVDADLDAADGAEFLSELDVLADLLWRDDGSDDDRSLRKASPAERRAEALLDMARRSSTTHHTGDGGDRGPRPRRPQLVVVVDADALAGRPGGVAELEDGTIVGRSVLERWACDCSLGRVVMQGPSVPFDLGKITYTPSAGQRRALIARDRGCIVPGCRRQPRWCEAHHVIPWPEGPTNLDNLVLVCGRHHKHIHAGLLELVRHADTPPGRWQVIRRDGTPLLERPPPRLVA